MLTRHHWQHKAKPCNDSRMMDGGNSSWVIEKLGFTDTTRVASSFAGWQQVGYERGCPLPQCLNRVSIPQTR